MILGAVLTPTGWQTVSLDIHVQRAGLPQFIVQGYGRGVKVFRQAILIALQKRQISLPHGKILVNILLPPGQVWGAEALVLPVVMMIQEKISSQKSSQSIVAAGCTDFSGNLMLPDCLGSLVAQSQFGTRVLGSIPDQARSWIVGDVIEVPTLQSLDRKGAMPLSANAFKFPSHSLDHVSTSFPTLPVISELHALCLALVWAGGHSLLLFGSPGEGKTLSRDWLDALAPPISSKEQCDRSEFQMALLNHERSQTLGIPASATLTQWEGIPHGYLRLISYGVGWIDELPELSSSVRIRLRSWLDRTDVEVRKLVQRNWYSSIVATMNPCPCGYWGESRCLCTIAGVNQILKRVSWPLIERFPVQWRVESPSDVIPDGELVNVHTLRKRILAARSTQFNRAKRLNAFTEIWGLSQYVRDELRVWGHHCADWSPRRQVFLAQVAQTLLDGEWSKNPEEAFSLAWRLCSGSEALRPATGR